MGIMGEGRKEEGRKGGKQEKIYSSIKTIKIHSKYMRSRMDRTKMKANTNKQK